MMKQNRLGASLAVALLLCAGLTLWLLEEQRPLVQKATSDYQKFNEPLIRHFTGALQSFALAHRDFQPVLEKYRAQLKQYYTTPGPSTRPAGK